MNILSKIRKYNILRRGYMISLALTILLVIAIFATRTSDQKIASTNSYISIEDQLTLSPGGDDYVDTSKLGQYFEDNSDTLSLYWTIPDTQYDESLIFRTKDIYCQVLLNNRPIYNTSCFESKFYLASPGNNWNFVTIPSSQSGKIIEIRLQYVYGTKAVSADHFFWGNKSDWILSLLMEKALAVFFSVMLIFAGIMITAMSSNAYKRSGRHSLVYLGIYSIMMGLWSLIETNVMQFAFPDGRFLQLLDNLLMITDTLPLFFYLEEEFDILNHKIVKIIISADLIYIFVCVIGQLTGLTDIHYLLKGSWIATAVSFICLVVVLTKQFILLIRGAKVEKSIFLQLIGFCSLMVIVIFTLPLFLASDGMDRAQSIRFGMLIMIIMFAFAGQMKTYDLIKQGTRYDVVKNLAYLDGLTGLKNRTSYLEKLEKYNKNPPEKLGMVFFDVNNLKQANDNYGHEMGDKLICTAARIIDESFGEFAYVYRTGGDEFIALLNGSDPQRDYELCLRIFRNKIQRLNDLPKFPFPVIIAQGFAQREAIGETYVQEMIKKADERMYENKRKLKEKAGS